MAIKSPREIQGLLLQASGTTTFHYAAQQRIVVHDGKALAVLTVFVKRTLMKLQRWIFRDQIDYALYGKFVPN